MAENGENSGQSQNRASPSEKEYVRKVLKRQPSYLKKALKLFTQHDTRGVYEKHNVPFQCEAVLGPFGRNRTCWLCGFPIEHLYSLVDSEGNNVFQYDAPGGKMLDNGVCEHVLPVKLGHGLLELFLITRDPIYKDLLHTEYEFAHNYCNYQKSDEYFVSLPFEENTAESNNEDLTVAPSRVELITIEMKKSKDKKSKEEKPEKKEIELTDQEMLTFWDPKNFCNLQLKEKVINSVLYLIFFGRRGKEGEGQSSIVHTTYKGRKLQFPNLVQAYCFTNNPTEFLANKQKFYREKWFPYAKKLIVDKMKGVISYIKAADKCDADNNTVGTHFRGLQTRLQTGLKNVPKGLKGPKVLSRLNNEYLDRIARIQAIKRQPSYNRFLELLPEEERLRPFRTKSFSGLTFLRPSSRQSNATTATTATATTNTEDSSSSSSNLEAIRQRLLAGVSSEEFNTEEEAAPASTTTNTTRTSLATQAQQKPRAKLTRQTATRKLVKNKNNSSNWSSNNNTSNTSNSNSNNNNNNNNNNTTSKQRNVSIFRKPFTRKKKAAVAAVAAVKEKPLKNGLRKTKENTVYRISGETYKYRNNIKKINGRQYNGATKTWTVPLTANLTPIQKN